MSQQTPERSLADEAAAAAAPAPASPLGTPNPSPAEQAAQAAMAVPPAVSIIDDILDLDALLSSDVRRAEDIARIFMEPWRQATITALNDELRSLTDATGMALPVPEGGRTAHQVAVELQTEQAAYAASSSVVRLRQMTSDDLDAFLLRHKDSDRDGVDRPVEFWDELIAASACEPKMTVEQARGLRQKLGRPAMALIGNTAWEVNTKSGVSVPKSPLSSAVLRHAALSRS